MNQGLEPAQALYLLKAEDAVRRDSTKKLVEKKPWYYLWKRKDDPGATDYNAWVEKESNALQKMNPAERADYAKLYPAERALTLGDSDLVKRYREVMEKIPKKPERAMADDIMTAKRPWLKWDEYNEKKPDLFKELDEATLLRVNTKAAESWV
ncbi:unnamed protein product, partial [marine sediment metagenome]